MLPVTYDYEGSQVLFRQAKAQSIAARRRADDAEAEQADGRSGVERRQRERDAVILTLILTQGAAEGYANWVHIQAETPLTHSSWIDRWARLPEAARALGRPNESTLSAEHQTFLERLGAWRNFLLHADSRARDRLRLLLTNGGGLRLGQSEFELLNADLAEAVVAEADQLFRWAQDLTGVPAPFLMHAWVAPDEP